MSKIRGELRQLSPARRLLGLLPVLVVALAVAAALGGVGVAGADVTADAGSAAEAETTSETTADADDAAVDEATAEETSEPAADAETDNAANSDAAESTDSNASASDADSAEADAETPAGNADDAAAKAAAPAADGEDKDLVGDPVYPSDATATQISIDDQVKSNGEFVLKAKIDGRDYTGVEAAARLKAAGYTVTWTNSKGENCANNLKKVTTSGPVQAVEENGGWINVAYTNGAKATYTVQVSKTGHSGLTAEWDVTYGNQLENGSFETNTGGYFSDTNPESNVSPWKTTATNKCIEVLNKSDNGTLNGYYMSSKDTNHAAAQGNNWAELNAKGNGALYQDVLTVPGETMSWRFNHRARTRKSPQIQYSSGTDNMSLIIAPLQLTERITGQADLERFRYGLNNGSVRVTDADGSTKTYSVDKSPVSVGYYRYDLAAGDGTTYTVYMCDDAASFTGGVSSWKRREGSLNVPAGQFTSRFFFMARETASGDTTVGNFLDDVYFQQGALPVAPDQVTITVEKVVKGLSEQDAKGVLERQNLISTTCTNKDVTMESTSYTYGGAAGDGYKATYGYTFKVDSASNNYFKVSERADIAEVENYRLATKVAVGDAAPAEGGSATASVQAGSGAKVTLTNTYTPSTRTLKIKKVVSGSDKTGSFRVTVTSDKAMTAISSTDKSVVDDAFKDATNKTEAELHLKDNEIVTLTVPYNAVVTVNEPDVKGYTPSYEVADGGTEGTPGANGYQISGLKADTTVTVKNTADPVTLTIQKNLTGDQADTTKPFTVKVSDANGNYFQGTIKDSNATDEKVDGQNQLVVTQLTTDKDGNDLEVPITLRVGDTVTVTENTEAGYSQKYQTKVGSDETPEKDGNLVSVELVDSATVVFHNDKIDTPVTGIKSAGIPAAITAVGIAALAIAGGFAYMRRNAPEQAPSGAHMGDRKRGW